MPTVSIVKLTKYHSHSSRFPSYSARIFAASRLYPWRNIDEKIYFEMSMKKTGQGRFGESRFLFTLN
jgi:hypothetical protein